jgi:hypothetical protein
VRVGQEGLVFMGLDEDSVVGLLVRTGDTEALFDAD